MINKLEHRVQYLYFPKWLHTASRDICNLPFKLVFVPRILMIFSLGIIQLTNESVSKAPFSPLVYRLNNITKKTQRFLQWNLARVCMRCLFSGPTLCSECLVTGFETFLFFLHFGLNSENKFEINNNKSDMIRSQRRCAWRSGDQSPAGCTGSSSEISPPSS